MSKPVTNEEVEDVLSSIRRLVSEDKRPLAGLRAAVPERAADEIEEAAAADEQPVNDRLVLTPALRVAVDTSDSASAEHEEGPLDLGTVARETWVNPDERTDDDFIANIDGLDAQEDSEAEPMMLAPEQAVDDDSVDAMVHDAVAQIDADQSGHAQSDEDHDDDSLEDGDYSDEGYWEVEEDTRHESAADLTPSRNDDASDLDMDEEISFETVRVLPTDAQSDYGNPEVEQPTVAQADEKRQTSDTEKMFFESGELTARSTDDLDEGSRRESSTLLSTAKMAALEAAIGEIASEWEPDGDEVETLASAATPAAMAWEDDLQLDAKGAPLVEDTIDDALSEPEPAPEVASAAAPVGTGFGAEDQLLDEETLRELVSEIVRAELQGALGERITRNVRKLVRREIHRALTAQDME